MNIHITCNKPNESHAPSPAAQISTFQLSASKISIEARLMKAPINFHLQYVICTANIFLEVVC